jgi:hypothetical protein
VFLGLNCAKSRYLFVKKTPRGLQDVLERPAGSARDIMIASAGAVTASSSPPSAVRLPNVTDLVSCLCSRMHAVTFLSCSRGRGLLPAIGTCHSIAEQRGKLLEKRTVAKNTQQSAIFQELVEQHQLVQAIHVLPVPASYTALPCTSGPSRSACAVTRREAITNGATRLIPSIRESVPRRPRLVLL